MPHGDGHSILYLETPDTVPTYIVVWNTCNTCLVTCTGRQQPTGNDRRVLTVEVNFRVTSFYLFRQHPIVRKKRSQETYPIFPPARPPPSISGGRSPNAHACLYAEKKEVG